MPEVANHIEVVVNRDGGGIFLINGEEFPWDVTVEHFTVQANSDDVPVVTVGILTDHVTVRFEDEGEFLARQPVQPEPVEAATLFPEKAETSSSWNVSYRFEMLAGEEPPTEVVALRCVNDDDGELPFLVRSGDQWAWSASATANASPDREPWADAIHWDQWAEQGGVWAGREFEVVRVN